MVTKRFLARLLGVLVVVILFGGCQYIKDLYGGEDVSYVSLGDVPIEEKANDTLPSIEIVEQVPEANETTPINEPATEEKTEVTEEKTETEVVENAAEAQEGKAIVIIASETDLVNLVPKASDPDADKLAYTYTSPLGADGKWQTKYGDAGEYTITVTVSDGELSSTKDVLLIVNKKDEAPKIDSFSPDTTAIKIKETDPVDFKVSASDLNSDPLTYAWKYDGTDVSSTDSFAYKSTYDDAGSHTVKLDISDSALTTTQLWSISVENVNRKPELAKIEDITVKEGETVKISPQATDPDGDAITSTISDPVGDDGVWDTTYDDAGEYDIKVTASDGTEGVSQDVKVIVENVNRAPVIADITKG